MSNKPKSKLVLILDWAFDWFILPILEHFIPVMENARDTLRKRQAQD